MSKVEVTHAALAISHSPRHARYADSPDPVARFGSRLPHRAAAATDLARCGAGQPGVVIPCAAPAGTEEVADVGVAPVGDRPRSEILFAHARGPEAARGGKGKLEPAHGCRRADLQRGGIGHGEAVQPV